MIDSSSGYYNSLLERALRAERNVSELEKRLHEIASHHEELVNKLDNAEQELKYALNPSHRIARPLSEWHENIGNVLWWKFPIEEPPYCGTPLDDDWTGYHTHWTTFIIPDEPEEME